MRIIVALCIVAGVARGAWMLDGRITDAMPTTIERAGTLTVNATEADVLAAGGQRLDGPASAWVVVDDEPRPAPTVDESALEAAWLESTERASRVAAANIVTSIKSTLAQIGVTPRERAQVIGDVTSWVSGGPGQKADRLEVSLRLMLAYERLAELVGDTTGLIAGTRRISLERGTPAVVEVGND